MIVFADDDWVGAQDELQRFGFRHLAIVEDVPSSARAASGLAAFQFGAQEIDAGLLSQRTGVRRPFNISLLVNIPVVALATNQSELPPLCWPVGKVFAGCGWVGERETDASGGGHGATRILASDDGLQIHKSDISAGQPFWRNGRV